MLLELNMEYVFSRISGPILPNNKAPHTAPALKFMQRMYKKFLRQLVSFWPSNISLEEEKVLCVCVFALCVLWC